jgi:hypothetical protein
MRRAGSWIGSVTLALAAAGVHGVRGPLLVLALLLAVRPAAAMHVRTDDTVLARSPDGRSALHELRGHGPEGGGSLAYRIVGGGPRFERLLASDFSNGGSVHPQIVAAATCTQRLTELAQELDRRGFHGVTARPERCHTRERDGLLLVGR